ncbi:ketopantoate reductase family protein [Schumannella sp. 10F1B-5-1]|uniref:ketopantoate reductase family protein n=1 Tax=Schumannella sp. 10F1B-5-1 TaxID=2590780 RepID=UPI001131FB32|nr:2-dehydropantoate 2-reductase [Schumannella sp. 10F1B-5-1]TPW72934.1 2-dehydropantoate 2-reductase [Schumannella sp. 10F1B-5-1]
MPHIAILGSGANGAGIACDLVDAGHDVTIIEQWPENVAALREHGIRVDLPDGTRATAPIRALNLSDVATLRGERFDVVLVVMKAYDTRWACQLIEPYLAPDGIAVGLQNGMTVDIMSDVFGPHRTLGAVIEIAAAMWEPGLVERHTGPAGTWFAVGSLSDATVGRETEITDILRHAGTAVAVDDIRSAKWMKLVVNAAELVTSAIVDLPLLSAARLPGMHDFMLKTGKEAIHVAVASGRSVVPIFGLTDVDPANPDGFVESMLDAVYTQWSLPKTKTTVLQDWQKGRRGEVDQLNGYVVEIGAQVGVPTPANQRTVEIAHLIESGEIAGSPDNLQRLITGI